MQLICTSANWVLVKMQVLFQIQTLLCVDHYSQRQTHLMSSWTQQSAQSFTFLHFSPDVISKSALLTDYISRNEWRVTCVWFCFLCCDACAGWMWCQKCVFTVISSLMIAYILTQSLLSPQAGKASMKAFIGAPLPFDLREEKGRFYFIPLIYGILWVVVLFLSWCWMMIIIRTVALYFLTPVLCLFSFILGAEFFWVWSGLIDIMVCYK